MVLKSAERTFESLNRSLIYPSALLIIILPMLVYIEQMGKNLLTLLSGFTEDEDYKDHHINIEWSQESSVKKMSCGKGL